MRKYEPNTVLQDIGPEANLQPDDVINFPQYELYVITWETNFGEFPDSTEEVTIPTPPDVADTSKGIVVDASPQDEIFTDVDLRSTGLQENDTIESPGKTCSDRPNDELDDQKSSRGSDTIVPEVLEVENDDVIVENKRPRATIYNLRPNPTPNSTDEYRY